MVVLNRIYTRTGDRGTTALGSGERVSKHSLRVEAYGTVDETNATIGLVRLHANDDLDAMLATIQNDLFDLGADLCLPEDESDEGPPYEPLRMVGSQIERLEADIDRMNASLDPLRSFVLPGGSVLSAHLHVSRTIARRAERLVAALAEAETVTPNALRYLNRLSDWLFVAARYANNKGQDDVLWVPGDGR